MYNNKETFDQRIEREHKEELSGKGHLQVFYIDLGNDWTKHDNDKIIFIRYCCEYSQSNFENNILSIKLGKFYLNDTQINNCPFCGNRFMYITPETGRGRKIIVHIDKYRKTNYSDISRALLKSVGKSFGLYDTEEDETKINSFGYHYDYAIKIFGENSKAVKFLESQIMKFGRDEMCGMQEGEVVSMLFQLHNQ